MRSPWFGIGWVIAAILLGPGCSGKKDQPKPAEPSIEAQERKDSRPPPMARPVPLWDTGKSGKQVDAATAATQGLVLLDLGEAWTPYVFDTIPGQEPPAYRKTYLALAQGQFPDNHHGERAKNDQYLELYGIMPTLGVLLERISAMAKRECIEQIDLRAFQEFDGFVAYRSERATKQRKQAFEALERRIKAMLAADASATTVAKIDVGRLSARDASMVREYTSKAPGVHAVRAAQERIECEGYFEGLGRYMSGVLDWRTHEALARFERRHRVYGWGYIGRETLQKLRAPTLELERQAVVRVLTERAMHSVGVIEDGSTSTNPDGTPRMFVGADGKKHPIPNMQDKLQAAVVTAFGLQTPESTLAWLTSLGDVTAEYVVAIPGPQRPEYYDGNMDLSVEIDRGDVWYDFPFDENGKEVAQPVQRRPRLTLFTKYQGKTIPLVRIGTTIGGWRSDYENGYMMWRYKGSPTGTRVWRRISAAPVWLPPESTPPRGYLKRSPKRGVKWEINYHEMGPSYASAFGLVAAYHEKFFKQADGTLLIGGDEGIRTHGSVDYMSIARRHSHGCHRLHNHLAVRLMSFVLAHRPHKRIGQRRVLLSREFKYEDETYMLELREGGYDFELEEPLFMTVLEGRIRGQVDKPIEHAIPKYDDEVGAYVMPAQGAVRVDRRGRMTPIPWPVDPDEQAPDKPLPGDFGDLGTGMIPLPGAAPPPVSPPPEMPQPTDE